MIVKIEKIFIILTFIPHFFRSVNLAGWSCTSNSNWIYLLKTVKRWVVASDSSAVYVVSLDVNRFRWIWSVDLASAWIWCRSLKNWHSHQSQTRRIIFNKFHLQPTCLLSKASNDKKTTIYFMLLLNLILFNLYFYVFIKFIKNLPLDFSVVVGF